jgi:hypothetical protein
MVGITASAVKSYLKFFQTPNYQTLYAIAVNVKQKEL